jgi:ABC-2 type transport system permease protein
MLVRPRSTVLQLAGVELALRRVGRLVQGVIVLVWAAGALDVSWTLGDFALLGFALVGAACLFFGLFVLQATVCFWTTESLELMNTMTYGGVQSAQYPLVIYGAWFRRLFTFVIPIACVSYFPVVAILGKSDPLGTPYWLQCVTPFAGIAFLLAAIGLWRVGVRHYTSTGS